MGGEKLSPEQGRNQNRYSAELSLAFNVLIRSTLLFFLIPDFHVILKQGFLRIFNQTYQVHVRTAMRIYHSRIYFIFCLKFNSFDSVRNGLIILVITTN